MSLIWLRLAVLLYGVAALSVLPAALYNRLQWRHLAIPATVAGLGLHLVSFVEMLNAAHHRLPVDAHETLSLLGILVALAFLLVYWRYRTISLGIILLPIAFLLGLLPAFRPGPEVEEIPGLHTGWLFLHIALLLAAYASLLVSLVSSLLYMVQERRLKTKSVGGKLRLPPLDTIDSIGLRALRVGLPCMTGGLLIGSFLAETAYGASYFRDPKILLAFAMWLAYVAMLFIRRMSGLRGRRAVYLSSFVFLVILVVWASNQLSVVHRYAAR